MKLPALGSRGQGWLAAQVVILGLILLCGFIGPGWPDPAAQALRIVGVIVGVAGCVLAVAGGLALGPSLTPLPRPKEDASLSDRGVYGLVRHPIYGGVLLAAIGWSLATAPLALVPTALGVVFLELKSEREEAWLAERYPNYRDYRRRVRWKFVPGIR